MKEIITLYLAEKSTLNPLLQQTAVISNPLWISSDLNQAEMLCGKAQNLASLYHITFLLCHRDARR